MRFFQKLLLISLFFGSFPCAAANEQKTTPLYPIKGICETHAAAIEIANYRSEYCYHRRVKGNCARYGKTCFYALTRDRLQRPNPVLKDIFACIVQDECGKNCGVYFTRNVLFARFIDMRKRYLKSPINFIEENRARLEKHPRFVAKYPIFFNRDEEVEEREEEFSEEHQTFPIFKLFDPWQDRLGPKHIEGYLKAHPEDLRNRPFAFDPTLDFL